VKASEEWGEVVELREETGPIVFHFRPTKYMRVSPDRLKEWEEFFARNVGLRPDRSLASDYMWSGDPKETISGSNDDWDDCDYW
jgi:hypothetical protein